MDSYWLTGPQGTQFNLGSWLQVDPGPDFGAAAIMQQVYADNAYVDVPQFAFETAAVRKMAFPLLIASGGAGLTLDGIEAALRLVARPGGYIDMQPDGVPTAEMVRFDILGGRLGHNPYQVRVQGVKRRLLLLELDTPPFGYWPTWITLASVTTPVTAPLRVPLRAASVIGDWPGLVQLMLMPTSAARPSSIGSHYVDMMAWGIGNPSALAVLPAASFTTFSLSFFLPGDSYASDLGSPTTILQRVGPGSTTSFGLFGLTGGAYALDQTFRGRYRAFGYYRADYPEFATIDVVPKMAAQLLSPLASAAPIASLWPIASLAGGSGYAVYDLGEITVPPPELASFATYTCHLRAWYGNASRAVSTSNISFAGIGLLPLDGGAGILPGGAIQPSPGNNSFRSGLMIDSARNMVGLRQITTMASMSLRVDDEEPWWSARSFYRGQMPRLGASDAQLVLFAEPRITGSPMPTNNPPIRGSIPQLSYSLAYRPRFAFLKGI